MKFIAISQRVEIIENINERRDALSQEWGVLAEKIGFLPILIPNNLQIVKNLINNINFDGILLTGGNNLVSYNGDAPERDDVERFLIEYSIKASIPLLGICRGMQMILDYFGTPLYKVNNHIATKHILDDNQMVNSFHGFGAKECLYPLMALSRSDDGVLESVRHIEYNWINGIMWHPERYESLRDYDVKMFKEVFSI